MIFGGECFIESIYDKEIKISNRNLKTQYLCCGYPRSRKSLFRRAENLYRQFFLYESDEISKEDQLRILNSLDKKPFIKYIVDSANKSIHTWIKLPEVVDDKLLELCSRYEEQSWKFVGELYGLDMSIYDKHCKNISRIGRCPLGVRDNGQIQDLLFEGSCMRQEDTEALFEYLVKLDEEITYNNNRNNRIQNIRKSLINTSRKVSGVEFETEWKDLPFDIKWKTLKNKSENMQLFYDLYNNITVPSGSNLVGAIYSGASIKCNRQELLQAANNAHRQHPSNIPKPENVVNKALSIR